MAVIDRIPANVRHTVTIVVAIGLSALLLFAVVERITNALQWASVGVGLALWNGASTLLVIELLIGVIIWKRAFISDKWDNLRLRIMTIRDARRSNTNQAATGYDQGIRDEDDERTGYEPEEEEDPSNKRRKKR